MTPDPADTIVAVSSAAGPGRRAVVRVSGPAAAAVVAAVFAGPPLRRRHLSPGDLRLTGVHSTVPADVYYFPGPHSYTGQDLAELHLISSGPLVERLVADLLAAGARPAGPGEFTLGAFLAGKMDLTRAEAVLSVIEAGSDADLTLAMGRLAGGVSDPLRKLRSDLLDLLADVEAGLDFVDEDISFVSAEQIIARVTAGLDVIAAAARQFDSRDAAGRPFRVTLAGAPNAGKSSLFNALVGRPEAIVGPAAGTTRDYLTRRLDLGGAAVDLADTPGVAAGTDDIETAAQELGAGRTADADLVLWCVPAGEAAGTPPPGEFLLVRTKCDSAAADAGFRTSATTGAGVRELLAELAARAAAFARPPAAPAASRCRQLLATADNELRRAAAHAAAADPQELTAAALRTALAAVGEMAGAVYTNDLLDRVFSRFCIGK